MEFVCWIEWNIDIAHIYTHTHAHISRLMPLTWPLLSKWKNYQRKVTDNNTCHYGSKQVTVINIHRREFVRSDVWIRLIKKEKKWCFWWTFSIRRVQFFQCMFYILYFLIPFVLMESWNNSSTMLNPSRNSRLAI